MEYVPPRRYVDLPWLCSWLWDTVANHQTFVVYTVEIILNLWLSTIFFIVCPFIAPYVYLPVVLPITCIVYLTIIVLIGCFKLDKFHWSILYLMYYLNSSFVYSY